MTGVVKKYLFAFIAGFLSTLNCCTSLAEDKFKMLDMDVIGNIMEDLNSKSVVFVEDGEDVSMVNNMKVLSGKYVYHTVVSKSSLRGILEGNQMNFFQRKTTIVTKEMLKLSLLLKKVSSPHFLTWILFKDHTRFPKLNIPVSNQVLFINSTSERTSAIQVYHLKPETKATVKTFDVSSSIPFRMELEKINFQNVTMNMLILNQKEVCLSLNTTLRKLECSHQEILESIAIRLNFSINIVECMEKENPFAYPNGSDSVLFLKLKTKEVDFSAIGHVVLKNSKRDYMDFAWPTFVLKSRIYLRQGRLAGRWRTYTRPLERSVWLGILIWILTTGVLLQIFEKLLTNRLKFNISFVRDLIYSTLKALQVFCNQALSDIPSSYSIRIIYFLKFFTVLIFFQAYCGYLASSITVQVSNFPFKDLKGFFENQQYRIITLRRGFHQYYFRKVIGEGRKKSFMLPQDDLPNTIQQAVDRLCKQKYLALGEFREDLLNFNRLNCIISELPTPTAQLHIGIAMPKGTPLKEFLKRELLHLRSTGLVKKLSSQLSSRADFREKFSQKEFRTVKMSQIFSIFVFLGFGVILSILILVVELIIERFFLSSSRNSENKFRKFEKYVGSSFCTPKATPLMATSFYRNR